MAALVPRPKRPKRSHIQLGALAFGVVFLLVGLAGFVPGITSHYMNMEIAGRDSSARLMGIFQVSVLHNVVHLLFGVAGLLCSGTPLRARNYLLWGGAVYAVIFFYGILVPYASGFNFVPLNAADDFLHFVLAAAMIGGSVVLDRGPAWTEMLEEGKADV